MERQTDVSSSHLEFVDPFWGNGEIDLPRPEGIAAAWMFLKAQTGNTHPGATLPFGMVSACAHSGAYPCGYGTHAPNTHGRVPKRFPANCANGFAHFHPSGTGAVGVYYNFFKVQPLAGSLSERNRRWNLVDESATPGYYHTDLDDVEITAELTTARTAALHRYIFPATVPPRLAVDASAGGIDADGGRTRAEEVGIRLPGPGSAEIRIVMDAMPIFACIETNLAEAIIWVNDREIESSQWACSKPGNQTFGVLFTGSVEPRVANLRIGFSLRSMQRARANLQAAGSFDETRSRASSTWGDMLGRIDIDADDPTRERFYSALYHSLIKPADFHGESPFWADAAYCTDFATLWDTYKTQLPLIATVYPERGREIVNSLLNQCDYSGHFPNMVLMTGKLHKNEEKQARGLAHLVIADAWFRGVPGIDWERALRLMLKNLYRDTNRDFLQHGTALPLTHTLDLAQACHSVVLLAQAFGHDLIVRDLAPLSRNWRTVYEPSGLLRDGEYYEGTRWNYSFRLLHDMAGRIALCGRDRFIELLDRFFGYGAEPVTQIGDPGDQAYHDYAYSLCRFEGFNNEPDMEAPYAYLYAGRHDRTAEIVRTGMQCMFTTGRGGAPGNVDSGGLSACFVWNALGLFPVAGQPVVLIGSPLVRAATLHLPGGAFEMVAHGNSNACIYVQSARLNGRELDRAYLTIDELLAGGRLELVMGDRTSTWAVRKPPPSWPL